MEESWFNHQTLPMGLFSTSAPQSSHHQLTWNATYTPTPTSFSFTPVLEEEDVLKKLTKLDVRSVKLLQMFAPAISTSITSIFNASPSQGCFPTEWKEANVMPVPKSGDRHEVNDFRPVSVLLRATDDWKKALDLGQFVAKMMDLSKAFDYINYDLLLKKLYVYGIQDAELAWFADYLSCREETEGAIEQCSI